MMFRMVAAAEHIRIVVNIIWHDCFAGVPRRQLRSMLRIAEDTQADNTDTVDTAHGGVAASGGERSININMNHRSNTKQNIDNSDLCATCRWTSNANTRGKGCGECRHCWEWGHPRREGPYLNESPEGKGALSALGGRGGGGTEATPRVNI